MPSDDISRLYDFVANTLIQSSQVDDEFNQLVETCNGKAGRAVDNTFSGTNTFSGAVNLASVTGNPIFSGNITVPGTINIARATNPTSPADGTVWFDTVNFQYKFQLGGVTRAINPGAYADYYRGSACPVYASSTTYTVAFQACISSDLTFNIFKNSSTTVDVSTNALNGMAQSADLTGTIGTGGSSSTTITGSSTTFTTDFIVGDVIWTSSGARRITAIGSNTSLTVESAITLTNGTTYRRGGLAPNTFYNQYEVLTDPFNTAIPGIYLDTRNVAGGDAVPNLAGMKYRQSPFAVRIDSSSHIIPFYVSNWGLRPSIFFRDFETGSAYRVLNAGNSTTAFTNPGGGANIDMSSFVPKISKEAFVNGQMSYASGSGTWSTYLKSPDSASTAGKSVVSVNSVGESIGVFNERVPLNSSQQLAYRVDNQSVTIYCQGFTVTEVA
jgi:hypothetical protein